MKLFSEIIENKIYKTILDLNHYDYSITNSYLHSLDNYSTLRESAIDFLLRELEKQHEKKNS